jgi:hypothetical protein
MSKVWSDPTYLRIVLGAVALALAALAVMAWRARAAGGGGAVRRDSYLATEVLAPRSFLVWGLVRAAALVAILVLAGCLVLILVPENTMQKLVTVIRAARADEVPAPKISLLYLGDEMKGNEFHIRGFVRNISTAPIQKLDASIRLYRPDGTLLETHVTRMDVETIPPDGTSEFHLVYPDYSGQFGSYSADFKLRDGDLLPYKDWRALRRSN